MKPMRHWLTTAVLMLVLGGASAAPAWQGKVTRVIDGQTVLLAHADGKPVQVGLTGIEAPPLCQPWGPEARDALKDWLLNREVMVAPVGPPQGGRVIAKVTLDGDDISRRMVEEGHAWSARVKWDRGPYVKQERMAQALTRGLHGVPGGVPPRRVGRTPAPCAA